jgi:anti-sigma factor RsiW
MSCSPFDLRDYWFEELSPEERRQVETHVAGCSGCHEEFERLRLTRQALAHLREEEVPRRIAFVSDKVFEPTRFARWWSGMPKLAFGLALVLAVFFGGVWATRPSLSVETGKWQVAFGGGSGQALAEMEARHTAQMRTVEETYELMMKQMNQLYLRQAEMAPASYRQ